MHNKDFLEKEYTIKPTLHWFEEPIEVTYLDDTFSRYITPKPYITSNRIKNIAEIKEESNVKIDKIKTSRPDEYVLICRNKKDLELEKILTTLSAMKNQLVYETLHYVPYSVPEIQCKMTPQVKSNLITVGKKLRMYGKRIPIIPNFDEYGNRLPDQIEILEGKGIEIIIVDPKEYKELYLEIKVTKKLSSCSDPDWWKELSDDWLPS